MVIVIDRSRCSSSSTSNCGSTSYSEKCNSSGSSYCKRGSSRSMRSRSYNVDVIVVEVVYINVLLGVV